MLDLRRRAHKCDLRRVPTYRQRWWALKRRRAASHLILPFVSRQDNSWLAGLDVAAVVAQVGIRGLKEVRPSHAVDVEAAVVTAAGPAVEAGAVAHKVARRGEDQHCWSTRVGGSSTKSLVLRMATADDVAMSIQCGFVHGVAASTIHVVNSISRSDDALVQELTQPVIHRVDWKGRGDWGCGGGGGCSGGLRAVG